MPGACLFYELNCEPLAQVSLSQVRYIIAKLSIFCVNSTSLNCFRTNYLLLKLVHDQSWHYHKTGHGHIRVIIYNYYET